MFTGSRQKVLISKAARPVTLRATFCYPEFEDCKRLNAK